MPTKIAGHLNIFFKMLAAGIDLHINFFRHCERSIAYFFS